MNQVMDRKRLLEDVNTMWSATYACISQMSGGILEIK
jgi:hypothetical protein